MAWMEALEARVDEIEENQDFDEVEFIRDWVRKIRELASKWTADGKRRSKSVGEELQFQAGHLGTCLEVFWEEIQGEEDDLSREISSYMAEMKFWFSSVPLPHEEKQLKAPEAALNLGRYDRQGLNEGDSLEFPKETSNQEDRDKVELGRKESSMEAQNEALQIQGCVSEERNTEVLVDEIGDNMPEMIDPNQEKKEVWSSASSPTGIKEVTDALQRMVAARERQVGESSSILGLILQKRFEPVVLLQMIGEEFGSKSELDPEPLGPPPWSGILLEYRGKLDVKYIGLNLQMIGPLHHLSQPFFLKGDQPFSLLSNIETRNGPVLIPIKHGPKIGAQGGTDHRLPEVPESISTSGRKHEEKSSMSLVLPPTRPPPHPPDHSSWKVSRLAINADTVTIFPSALRVSGKLVTAGDYPGVHFLRLPAPSFYLEHNLAGKAVVKGLARPCIIPLHLHQRLNCRSELEQPSFKEQSSPPPFPERPPPQPPDPSAQIWRFGLNGPIYVAGTTYSYYLRISGKMDTGGDDPGNFSTILPLTSSFNLKHSLEGKAVSKGSAGAVRLIEGTLVNDWVLLAPPPAKPPWMLCRAGTMVVVIKLLPQFIYDPGNDQAFTTRIEQLIKLGKLSRLLAKQGVEERTSLLTLQLADRANAASKDPGDVNYSHLRLPTCPWNSMCLAFVQLVLVLQILPTKQATTKQLEDAYLLQIHLGKFLRPALRTRLVLKGVALLGHAFISINISYKGVNSVRSWRVELSLLGESLAVRICYYLGKRALC